LLRILPPEASATAPDPDPALDPAGDHRMAFAFALLGLVIPHVFVKDAGCVAKSWPEFWEDLAALGAEVVEG
jgi:3-phosphoshikimate 1-carboxyvinyltransferase